MMEVKRRTVFMDLETGGFDPKENPIIQIGAVAVDDETFEEIGSFERKLTFLEDDCTKKALESNVYGINNHNPITWAALAVSPGVAVAELSRFLKTHASVEKTARAPGRPCYVARVGGHNFADFDLPFVRNLYKKEEMCMPLDWSVLDTMHRARWWAYEAGVEMENFKLDTLCKYFCIELEGAHDAITYARATSRLAAHLTGNV